MRQPPTIQPAPVPGPNFDPMDEIVQDLENIESFLAHLSDNPKDMSYLNTHISGILGLRHTISQHLEMLSEEPYNYPRSRLQKLHAENEKIFLFIEGVVGEMEAGDEKKFKKSLKAADEALTKFDGALTP